MKALLLIAVFSAVALANKDYDAMFREFKSTHLKAYAGATEEATRFANFVRNMKKAEVHQAANPLAVFGANQFADMSDAEFATRINGAAFYKKAMAESTHTVEAPLADIVAAAAPDRVDWRNMGAVTPVKDQGSCGSCWAFSATGNIESMWFIAGNPLTAVSDQQLTACDTLDSGCNGGLMDNAYNWLLRYRKGEIVTEAAYPYVSGSGRSPACRPSAEIDAMPVGAVITGIDHIARSEDTLAAYVLKSGPMSVAVDATTFPTSCKRRSHTHPHSKPRHTRSRYPPATNTSAGPRGTSGHHNARPSGTA